MRTIVAFAGLKKSGKTTLAKRLAASLAVPFASFGDQVRKEALRNGMRTASHEELQELGAQLVKTNATRFCQAVLDDAGFRPGHGLVLDGIRHVEVLALIKTLVGDQPVRLVYLESSLPDREQRSSLGAPELASIDSHTVERDAPLLKSTADLVLDTSADRELSYARLLEWTLQECN